MAVGGAKPKAEGEHQGRPKPPTYDWVEVPDVPNMLGPHLPKLRAGGRHWPKRTQEKWLAWRAMPHAALWTRADWDFALDTIEIAARFHEGSSSMAAELRQRENLLGTTMDARRDLRIKYVPPKPKQDLAVVVQADDYRDL